MTKYVVTDEKTGTEFKTREEADEYAARNGGTVSEVNEPDPEPQSQKEKDFLKFKLRASVKDQIIAETAAENMARLRSGIWSQADLLTLTKDPELKELLDDLNTLSYEFAYSKIDGLLNPLITSDIKTDWKLKISAHFYNE
jgi:hypothetical protein